MVLWRDDHREETIHHCERQVNNRNTEGVAGISRCLARLDVEVPVSEFIVNTAMSQPVEHSTLPFPLESHLARTDA